MAYHGTSSGLGGSGYGSGSHDRYLAHNEQSTIHKMKETYWTTKQYVKKKLGKKEDHHLVASDMQLDAKLEVFRAVQKSCLDLLRVLEQYQERVLLLSQDENAMGRFLKTQSQQDKTRAGKMMGAVGKVQSQASQQRISLRVPLVRLYQEVETFRYRAISDTLVTINRMEAARTEYRGALLWMKDASEELDPDTYKQLEKFRKVQAQVKKSKQRFDKLKLDVMQKVDLLAASRCNMFSHVLANYQQTLLTFWNKTAHTHTAVAESFKGYQYYEFNMLKELTDTTKELADVTNDGDNIEGLIDLSKPDQPDQEKSGSLNNLYTEESDKSQAKPAKNSVQALFMEFEEDDEESLEEIKRRQDEELDITAGNLHSRKQQEQGQKVPKDLLSEEPDLPEDTDNLTLLQEIMHNPGLPPDQLLGDVNSVFGAAPLLAAPSTADGTQNSQAPSQAFLPSCLLDLDQDISSLNISNSSPPNQAPPKQLPKASKSQKPDMSAWFNLFADLDPLSNPDAVGRRPDEANNAF